MQTQNTALGLLIFFASVSCVHSDLGTVYSVSHTQRSTPRDEVNFVILAQLYQSGRTQSSVSDSQMTKIGALALEITTVWQCKFNWYEARGRVRNQPRFRQPRVN